MRILILQDHLRGGGTERQSITLAQALIQGGHEVQLLVGYRGGALDALAINALGERVQFISAQKWLHTPKAGWKLKQLQPSHDLTLCMGRWAHSLNALVPTPPQHKIISTVRTSRPLPKLYRQTILKSNRLIANSAWALQHAAQSCANSKLPEAHVVHNGLSRPELLDIGLPEKQAARARFQLAASRKVLLNVARLDPGKGQADLIRALHCSNTKNSELWLAGTGPEVHSLKQLAAQLKLSERVRFLGFSEDLRSTYAAADLFLSASKLDSLPNALLEAHAAGLPIIAYPSAGIPEIVDDAISGKLVAGSTPEGIAEAIDQLCANPETCLKMAKMARKKVQSHFTLEIQNAKFCALVEGLKVGR